MAQYDTEHYIPPFYSRSSEDGEIGMTYIFLSTNNSNPFQVTITESNGDIFDTVTISKNNPVEINLGWKYFAPLMVDSTGLNTPLSTEGIIVTGASPFFVNIRHYSAAQGMSLTSKGASALGTRFRSGHLFSNESASNDGPYKSHMISVMATEDSTTVTFSDIKQGVVFFNTPTTGNTSDDITVTLDKYETYVIAAHINEQIATGNDTLINGTLIESSKPIAVNTGSWCGGSDRTNLTPSRDIGMDQIVPVKLLGKEHIVAKRFSFNEEECQRVIVIADSNDTDIFINGSTAALTRLAAGEFFILPASSFDVNDNLFIESSKVIYVYQSTNGSDLASLAQGLNFIPPIKCSGLNEITIPILDSYDGTPAGIDVIAKVGSTVLVNGSPILVPSTPITGNSDWEIYRLWGLTGTVNIWCDNNVNVAMISHSGARGSAGYFSGFGSYDLTPTIIAKSLGGFNNTLGEGCFDGVFEFTKPAELLNEDVTYNFEIGGEAINGLDYPTVAQNIFIPAGTLVGEVLIHPIVDGIVEETESITLTWSNPNDCISEPIVKSLIIIKEPEIDFIIEPGVQCLPFEAKFINRSKVDGGATYHWDFGDGTTSSSFNPTHEYYGDGYFNVTLTVQTAAGCLDTLSLMKQDLVNTHPTPVADFTVDMYETDICNSLIQFTDLSIGGATFSYHFDDNSPSLTEQNPSYLYMHDGQHRPMQVVTSEHGCIDTAYQEIYIEPFSIFAPNTFTPDGNEHNNTFKPVVALDIYEWNLQIMNRWGEIVFQSNNVDEGWDGTSLNGEMSNDGTYVWTLTYISCEPINPRHQLTGHINLIR